MQLMAMGIKKKVHPYKVEPGVLGHTYNLCTWEAKAEEL